MHSNYHSTSCDTYAKRILSVYPKTRKELEFMLFQKGFSATDIDATIKKLIEKGILDDKRYADAYIYSACVQKGKPVAIVRKKLLIKGIDKHIIDATIRRYSTEIQEAEIQSIQKHITTYHAKNIRGLDLLQKLVRKGYSVDTIKVAVQKWQESSQSG